MVWLTLAVFAGLALVVFATQPRNRADLPVVLLFGLVAPVLLLWRGKSLVRPDSDRTGAAQQVRRTLWFLPLTIITGGSLWVLNETTRLPDLIFFTIVELADCSLWVLVPLWLFILGVWRWPQLARPHSTAVVLGALLALIICAIQVVSDPEIGRLADLPPLHVAVAAPLMVLYAFAEEVVFRVMLLSYLAAYLKSGSAALAVSSALFGFWHVPFDVVSGWPNHVLDNTTAGPLYKAAMGAFFGALWLRTRSLLLAGGAHSAFNLVPALLLQSDEWS